MPITAKDITVGWICAIYQELAAASELLDEEYPRDYVHYRNQHDHNAYKFGRIHEHHVAITCLPKGRYGTTSATLVATHMRINFPAIRIGLMVGIGGGAPSAKHDIRLGDVVVSAPTHAHGGVIQYDYGRAIQDYEFHETGYLCPPPTFLLNSLTYLAAQHQRNGHHIASTVATMVARNKRLELSYGKPLAKYDRLYEATYPHKEDCDCLKLDRQESTISSIPPRLIIRKKRDFDDEGPAIHYGLIASANSLMKDAVARDHLIKKHDVLCFEMEAAGLMDSFPCVVIRGVSDYSDSHKNDMWQGYAAATAAAFAKELLSIIPGIERSDDPVFEEYLRMSNGASSITVDKAQVQSNASFSTTASEKSVAKAGYLQLLENNTWITAYFAVQGSILKYNYDDEEVHSGSIDLKNTQIYLDPGLLSNFDREHVFQLLVYDVKGQYVDHVYTLAAESEAQYRSWIKTLEHHDNVTASGLSWADTHPLEENINRITMKAQSNPPEKSYSNSNPQDDFEGSRKTDSRRKSMTRPSNQGLLGRGSRSMEVLLGMSDNENDNRLSDSGVPNKIKQLPIRNRRTATSYESDSDMTTEDGNVSARLRRQDRATANARTIRQPSSPTDAHGIRGQTRRQQKTFETSSIAAHDGSEEDLFQDSDSDATVYERPTAPPIKHRSRSFTRKAPRPQTASDYRSTPAQYRNHRSSRSPSPVSDTSAGYPLPQRPYTSPPMRTRSFHRSRPSAAHSNHDPVSESRAHRGTPDIQRSSRMATSHKTSPDRSRSYSRPDRSRNQSKHSDQEDTRIEEQESTPRFWPPFVCSDPDDVFIRLMLEDYHDLLAAEAREK